MRSRLYESTVEHACGKGLWITARRRRWPIRRCRRRRPLTLHRVADHPEPWIGCQRHRQLCRPGPITLHDGATVGANATVIHDVGPGETVVAPLATTLKPRLGDDGAPA